MARILHKGAIGKSIYNNGRFDNNEMMTLGINYYLDILSLAKSKNARREVCGELPQKDIW